MSLVQSITVFKMRRRDWLHLFFALKGAPHGLDPVRIQKGMFLFAKTGAVDPDETYTFRPYYYGPMSSQIYQDVDRLEAERLIQGEVVPGYTWKRYRATKAGIEAARVLQSVANSHVVGQLYDIKREVSGKSFGSLLTDLYTQYPEYATRSVFKR